MKRLAFVFAVLLVSSLVFADSITIYGNTPPAYLHPKLGGPVLLNTTTEPLLPAYPNLDVVTSSLFFTETFSLGEVISSLSWTLSTKGTTNTITFSPQTCMTSTCSLTGTFSVPHFPSTVAPATLTVNLNGTKETFAFEWKTVVPEPATLLLLSTGLLGVGWRKYRAIGTANR